MLRSLVGSEMCIRDRFDGCELNPDSPADPFPEVLAKFDQFLKDTVGISLHDVGSPGSAARFLTCGDWDCKHVHSQCQICGVDTPTAFRAWVNVKRAWSDGLGGDIRGMKSMLARLGLLDAQGGVVHGFHHLGMHDVENICRCVLHLCKLGVDCWSPNGSLRR
eukprot:TRINITY_DN13373_c0_g1_i1.p1 TRINITY_DN13373_c0_g1~~TRINITY_DN13373_c0_g1_i1.p1  ORF type:complete len:178 (+),score=55.44 TRINITY_DN13373_c0_g1_i1:46-534(+)